MTFDLVAVARRLLHDAMEEVREMPIPGDSDDAGDCGDRTRWGGCGASGCGLLGVEYGSGGPNYKHPDTLTASVRANVEEQVADSLRACPMPG